MTPVSSVAPDQSTCTEKADVVVAVTDVGAVGAVTSPEGPILLVPKAASSKATSQVPLAVSPICSRPTGELPTSIASLDRSGTRTPSSHTSTEPSPPATGLTARCISTVCQPGPGDVELTVPAVNASLRSARLPPAVR